MTALEACDMIEQAIKDLEGESATQGWDWSFTAPLSDAEHVDNQRESLEKTRANFVLGENTTMWFVSTHDTDAILAMCGNSPSAQARSRYISWANPQNIKLIIDRLRELESK
jgi:hypothetical protein